MTDIDALDSEPVARLLALWRELNRIYAHDCGPLACLLALSVNATRHTHPIDDVIACLLAFFSDTIRPL